MKKISILFLILSIGLISCKDKKKEAPIVAPGTVPTPTQMEDTKPKKIKMTLSAKSESNVSGNVVFKEEDGQVSMTAIISGLEPGQHAIHIHESSDCSSAD